MLLAERGWSIGILDIDEHGGHALAAEIIEKYNVKTSVAVADVSKEDQVYECD